VIEESRRNPEPPVKRGDGDVQNLTFGLRALVAWKDLARNQEAGNPAF
jgi:hypothetical protein